MTIRIVSGQTTAEDVASQVAGLLKLTCAPSSLTVVCGDEQLKSQAVLPDSVLSDSENSPLHIYYPTGSIHTSEKLKSITYYLMRTGRKIFKSSCQNVKESTTIGALKSILRAKYSKFLNKGHTVKIYAKKSAIQELTDDTLVCDHKGGLYIMIIPPSVYKYRTSIDNKFYEVKLPADATAFVLRKYLAETHGVNDINNIKVVFAGKNLKKSVVLATLHLQQDE